MICELRCSWIQPARPWSHISVWRSPVLLSQKIVVAEKQISHFHNDCSFRMNVLLLGVGQRNDR